MRQQFWSATLLFCGSVLLNGCAALSTTQPVSDTTANNTAKNSKAQVEYPTRPFETETLYHLLVAEIAGQRSQYDLALNYYLDEAKHTKDPYVAARASRIAQYLNEPEAAAEAADIWREGDKKNIHAHLAAANNWLKQHNVEKSIAALRDALSITESISLEQIYLSGKELPEPLQQPFIDGLSGILTEHPKHVRLHFTKALLLSDFEQNEQALQAMNELQQAGEMTPPHYIMLAKLHTKTENINAAVETLETGWNNYTGDKTLGLLYAQALADKQQPEDALSILEFLVEQHPTDDEILISGALINAELGQYEQAEALFLQATNTKQRDNAWFFLGQLHEQQNAVKNAIEAYSQVKQGPNLISSITRATTLTRTHKGLEAARQHLQNLHTIHPTKTPRLLQIEAELMHEENNLQEALSLYNTALTLDPTDGNLLYGRAMILDLTGDLPGMERDLKTILSKDPNSSIALNALGYTLADKTDRLEEALQYIEKAYLLNPNDPAIIDSLGWIYFKLGDLEKAEALLMKAYDLFKDQEVAAHLGEVLWVQNKKEQGLKIWIDGLRRNPQGPKLLETMKRYNIDVNLEKEGSEQPSPKQPAASN